jgi:hypothetical protein
MSGSDLAALVGKPARSVTAILSAAGIAGDRRHGYDVRVCIPVIVAAQDAKLRAIQEETAKDRGRLLKNQADLAEMAREQKLGTLMLRSDASELWSDGFVRMRQKLEAADYIPAADRERLVAEFMTIELGKPEPSVHPHTLGSSQ